GDVKGAPDAEGIGRSVGVVRLRRLRGIRNLGTAARFSLSPRWEIVPMHLWVSLRSGRGSSPAATVHVATNPRPEVVHVDSGRVDLPAWRDFLVSAHAVGGQSERLSQLAAQGDVSV